MMAVSALPLIMMTFFAGGGVLPAPGTSSFDAVSTRLEPGGRLYMYVATDAYIESAIANAKDLAQAALLEEGSNTQEKKVGDLVFGIVEDSGIRQLTGFGVSSTVRPGGYYHNRFYMHHGVGKNTGKMWKLIGNKPGALSHLDLCPASTAVAEFGEFDLAGTWQWIKQIVEGSGIAQMQSSFNQFRGALLQQGIDLDRLTTSINGEFGLIVTLDPTAMQTFAPRPDFSLQIPDLAATLVFPVTTPELFDLFKLRLAPFAQLTETPERRVLQMPPVNTPVFTFNPVIVESNGLLFLASRPEIVDDCLAARAGTAPRLLDDPNFKIASEGLPLDADGFVCVSPQAGEMVIDIQKSILQQARAANASETLINLLESTISGTRPFFLVSVFNAVEDGWWVRSNSSLNAGQFLMMKTVAGPIFLGTVLPATANARKRAREVACMSNLRQISLALIMYANDHKGNLPEADGIEGLRELEPYLSDTAILRCPAISAEMPTDWAALKESDVSYVYFGGFKLKEVPFNTPVVFDKPYNHDNKINVGFADGHVESLEVFANSVFEIVQKISVSKDYDSEFLKLLESKAQTFDERGLNY
jgi:prepilin-type processing-associated H-X9-DG protein